MFKKLLFFLLITTGTFAQQVDTLHVFSTSMQKDIKNVVILPEDYTNNTKNYPVLYLLHGAYGSYTDWIKKVPEIKELASQYRMIIVCPDGHPFSWYLDSPIDPKFRYETYITQELITAVDKKYRTIDKKNGRGISGLSMGGHGAFYLAFKHPDLFGAAGSMSGGMDLVGFARKKNYELTKRLGNFDQYPENWINNTVINMTGMVMGKDLKLYFDCGVDDFLYKTNIALHKKLLAENIPHTYAERPGKHTWGYWRNSIRYHMVFFYNFFYG